MIERNKPMNFQLLEKSVSVTKILHKLGASNWQLNSDRYVKLSQWFEIFFNDQECKGIAGLQFAVQ